MPTNGCSFDTNNVQKIDMKVNNICLSFKHELEQTRTRWIDCIVNVRAYCFFSDSIWKFAVVWYLQKRQETEPELKFEDNLVNKETCDLEALTARIGTGN